MTGSGPMTTFILLIFSLNLMTCELVCRVEGCGVFTPTTMGVGVWVQAQDGQMKDIELALRTG